jgi:excisionase family DNA binding protein
MASNGKKMLTTSEVAKMLHIHNNTVRRWSKQGILKHFRIGPRGDRRFMRDDIISFLNSNNIADKSYKFKKVIL